MAVELELWSKLSALQLETFKCTVLLPCVHLVWMALFLLCCIESSNCYKMQRLLTSTVHLSSLAFGFLNKTKTISSGLWKQQWAASFQQQYVCELDGISLALLWNHLNLSFPYLRTILLHLFVKKKSMSLYPVLWSEQNTLLKYDSLSLAQQSRLYLVYNFWPQRALLGHLQKSPAELFIAWKTLPQKSCSIKCCWNAYSWALLILI